MSRKLLLDPYLAIHGKIMAKNGHFFMKFWPIFDIFHRLRPYLCTKRGEVGFHKQPTHRRRDDEPFFTLGSTVHDWGWPKNGPFWDEKWPNMAGLSTLQSGRKGPKRDQNGHRILRKSSSILDCFLQFFCKFLQIFTKNLQKSATFL